MEKEQDTKDNRSKQRRDEKSKKVQLTYTTKSPPNEYMASMGYRIDEPTQSHRFSTHHDCSKANLMSSNPCEAPSYHEDT